MKHKWKITVILVVMFLIAQLIGLGVVNNYLSPDNVLPYGLEPPKVSDGLDFKSGSFLISLIVSFVIAIFLIILLINIKSIWFMRFWFFSVVALALGITINVVTNNYIAGSIGLIIASIIALVLSYIKVYQRNLMVHNFTELLVYPGIAAIFVSILNIWTVIILLLIISAYDIWAVWYSGIMQKMAKFQMNKVKVFGGFLIPYAGSAARKKIKLLREKYKNKKIPESVAKKQNIRVEVALLGGGDVIFPIIAAGVFLKTFQSLTGALIVTAFSTLALIYLFSIGEKKKFYPAMPYITTGVFLGMIVAWLTVVL